MSAFEYTVLDAGGRRRKGILEGESSRQVRQQLRERGLIPVAVEEVNRRPARSRGSALLGPRVSAAQLALMTRQLATLVRSSLPLDDALQAVSEQVETAALKRVVLGVRARVVEGHTLASGLERFPGVFPPMFVSTVAAGEQTRDLPLVLERLADYTEERQVLQQKVQVALLYPAILTVTAVLVVAGLLTYVVPEVVKVFAHLHHELPPLTRALIWLSGAARAYGLWLAAVLLGLGTGLRAAMRRPDVRYSWQRLLLRLPLLGRLVRQLNAGRFARTLGILLSSGVSMIEAMHIAAQAVDCLPMRRAIEQARSHVREGESLHWALGRSKVLPPITVHLIANGEGAGNLEQMLDTAAKAHDRQVQTLLSAFLGLLEPLLILAMGGVVLTIVIAILLPIFELNQLV